MATDKKNTELKKSITRACVLRQAMLLQDALEALRIIPEDVLDAYEIRGFHEEHIKRLEMIDIAIDQILS